MDINTIALHAGYKGQNGQPHAMTLPYDNDTCREALEEQPVGFRCGPLTLWPPAGFKKTRKIAMAARLEWGGHR